MICNSKKCKLEHKMLDPIFEKHEQKKSAGAVLVKYDNECITKLENIALEKIKCDKNDRG